MQIIFYIEEIDEEDQASWENAMLFRGVRLCHGIGTSVQMRIPAPVQRVQFSHRGCFKMSVDPSEGSLEGSFPSAAG